MSGTCPILISYGISAVARPPKKGIRMGSSHTQSQRCPGPNLSRRSFAAGSALTLAGLSGFSRSAGAAQATPAASQADIDAYYIPSQRFEGGALSVALSSGFVSDERGQTAFDTVKAEFEELTGATVTYNPLPENELYNQVRLELANDSGRYDLMHTGAGGAKDYGLGGFLVPFDPPPDIADFYQGGVDQYSVGSLLYGLPQSGDINILYWRSDLFEAAGLDPAVPPQTYDEFREFAIRLTTDSAGNHPGEDGFNENDIQVFGSGYKGIAGLGNTWEWYNYAYAFGAQLFSENYEPQLNSAESVASLQWLVDNFQTHKIYPPDTLTYDYAEFDALFLQGRMAMALNWPYMWQSANDPEQSQVAGNVRIGKKPMQVTHGGNLGGWSWNVFQMSREPELAMAFAKYLAAPASQFTLLNGSSSLPARQSITLQLAEADPVLMEAVNENLIDARSVEWLNTGPSWTEIEQIQWEAIQSALIGDTQPQQAFDDANEEIRQTLEDNLFYEEIVPQLMG